MQESEKLRWTRLFLAACAKALGQRVGKFVVPYERGALVGALDEERMAGNAFAAQCDVINVFGGPNSPYFHEGLQLCREAGVVGVRTEWNDTLHVMLSPRQVDEITRTDELGKADALAKNYLRRVGAL